MIRAHVQRTYLEFGPQFGVNTNTANYFDHAATTPVDPRVVEAMAPFWCESFGNAHSLHRWGTKASEAVEAARADVAMLFGAEDPSEIVFTSGATEANQWLLTHFAGSVAISPFEHSSAWARRMENGGSGRSLENGIDADLASMMWVNNETGAIFDVGSLRQRFERVHSDVTQALGKVPIDPQFLDFASMSAHKLYGPKGVGALFARAAEFPSAMLCGGNQEFGFRSGTSNVPGIVGFGAACRIAVDEMESNYVLASDCRAAFFEGMGAVSNSIVHVGNNQSPYIISISFMDVEGEALVVELDHAGFAISSGAACSSGSTAPSHVLTAMGVSPEYVRGTVRVSFGRTNNETSSHACGAALAKRVESLRKLKFR